MRLALRVWFTTIILALLALWLAAVPCQAGLTNRPAEEVSPIITSATVSRQTTTQDKAVFQEVSSLSLSISTNKAIYLTGETIAITINTNVSNTDVQLLAQPQNGQIMEIARLTVSGSRTYVWQAPPSPGQMNLTCKGIAQVQRLMTGVTYTVIGGVVTPQTYYYYVTVPLENSASCEFRVFDRTTSISGRVTDTNQNPLPGASIYLSNTSQSTTADINGRYVFRSYQLNNNYNLNNQIPTVTETVSVSAIACEPKPGKTVQVQAERGTSDVDFTLKRFFYPAGIEPSKFTFDSFHGWDKAKEYTTWQNILGITVAGPVRLQKLGLGTKESPAESFDIGNEKLYLITKPQIGRYFLDFEGNPNADYSVATAATLDGISLKEVSISGKIGAGNSQRIRLILEQDEMALKTIESFPLVLLIVPTIVGLLGGLIAAFFITGRRLPSLGKAFAGIKLPQMKQTAAGRAKDETRHKTEVKRGREAKEKASTKKGKRAETKNQTKTQVRPQQKQE